MSNTAEHNSYLGDFNGPLLRHEEQCELATIIQSSKDEKAVGAARKKMTKANMRLVFHVAKKYRRRANKLQVDFNSLVQEGCIGLMRATETFDVEKDIRFSTYATYWIRQAIGRSLQNKATTVRVPVHMQETINRLQRVARMMEKMNGEKPTPREVASFLEFPEDKVVQAFQHVQSTVSLDKPVGNEDEGGSETTLGDFMEGDDTPEKTCQEESSRRLTRTVLRTLTPKEEKVLRLRFGF